jgi:hypothetical protein
LSNASNLNIFLKNITDEDMSENDIVIDGALIQTDIPYDSVLCDDCNCLSEKHLQ